jgi:thiamine biosynthesis lipoprotein ApbE/transcriptional regulator of nitric oxide reductase
MRRVFSKPNALRLYRMGVLMAIAALIHFQSRWMEASRTPAISLSAAKEFFPGATRIQLRDPERGLNYVLDSRGEALGVLLTTLPQTSDIIGYSGPNNLLIALDNTGAIKAVKLLNSGDTEEHVGLVKRQERFLRSFVGWKPSEMSPPKIEAVSGATLTSLAITESIQRRLAGAGASLRFPDAVTLDEVRGLFPNAARTALDGQRLRVLDARGQLLGYAIRTSPQADNVSGYRGPTEALAGLAADGRTITGVRLRKSFDTQSYVDQVRDDEFYLARFKGRTIDEMATLDFKKEKIEGVSGATQTSYAVAEGLKRRAAAELRAKASTAAWRPNAQDIGLAAVVAISLLIAFTSLRGRRPVRLVWQCVLIGYVGLASGQFISLALLGGWTTHGVALKAAPGLALLGAAAFLVPWFARRQVYCHHICPHGAAQQLLGGLLRRRWMPPAPFVKWLERLPTVLLGAGLVAVLLGWSLNLASVEPFDAWVWRAAGIATLVIAIVGLFASLFIPQAYCRFGCPTGALLNFARSTGSADHWGRRDWAGLAFLSVALLAVVSTRATSNVNTRTDVTAFSGRTMGTTWTVKIRGPIDEPPAVEKAIADQFEWAEQMTSHWRSNTDITIFNHSDSTEPIGVPWPVATLARWSAQISEASAGAFDITVGPLVWLWGFGPAPQRSDPPSDAEIDAVKSAVGWRKLEILDGQLRKQNPKLAIDLSAIAPGWANDQIASLLERRGFTNFLVESGGELRARGSWTIAIEHPTRSCTLSNAAVGTSGTYRQNWKSGGKQYSHLIDPRTGRPIAHNTVSVSVIHPDCAHADAWAAALNVLGVETGLPLANKLSLAAQFVIEKQNGGLEVQSSDAWQKTQSAVNSGAGASPSR